MAPFYFVLDEDGKILEEKELPDGEQVLSAGETSVPVSIWGTRAIVHLKGILGDPGDVEVWPGPGLDGLDATNVADIPDVLRLPLDLRKTEGTRPIVSVSEFFGNNGIRSRTIEFRAKER